MLKHEEKCWYNPKNRTCITCKFSELVNDYCDHDELPGCPTEHWAYRICHESHGEDIEFPKRKANGELKRVR
ncbi:hypothetical protein [Clostridium pasteurianum]|uniref:hypothetical protein n=1 Tax=Clostridium pasteurianum TaxID=1501 RepID=UPI0003A7461B|nr:hypothetical protein [Clostridium pasteurianum]